MKTNERVKKSRVKSRKSRVECDSKVGAAWGVFLDSQLSTLDFGLSNLRERTGNVDENKRPIWKRSAIPECVSARGHRVSDEVEQVKEQNEGRQSKADD